MTILKSCLLIVFFQAFAVKALESDSLKRAHEKVENTYASTRIINGHSNETLKKKVLEFRIEHKFGDMFGKQGGVQQFFGFDNISDIRFALEYGITNWLMIGVGRSKGSGPYKSLLDGFVKGRIIQQSVDNHFPISISAVAASTMTMMKSSPNNYDLTHYAKFEHRLAYSAQFIFTRKFKDYLSLALMPSIVHRNLVNYNDQNTVFSMGGAFRVKLSKKVNFLTEYYYVFHNKNLRNNFQNSLSFAFEFKTYGHVFCVYLTNANGFTESQFIPYTVSNWLKGEFRLGFSITRGFYL